MKAEMSLTNENIFRTSKVITHRAIWGYLFMAAVPFSYMRLNGNLISIGGHLLFYEAVIILSSPFVMAELALGKLKINITKLDILVIALAFLYLVPVCQGLDRLYSAAREYRFSLLGPLVVYFFYKAYFESIEQILIGFGVFSFALLFQIVIITSAFLAHGTRPKMVPFQIQAVPLSVMFAISVAYLLAIKKLFRSRLLKLFVVTFSLVFICGMIITMSRSPLLALGISYPLAVMVFRKQILQKFFIPSFVICIALFFALLTWIPRSTLVVKGPGVSPEIKRSVKRLYSKEFYIEELKHRISFWKSLYIYGLKRPFFGMGAGVFQTLWTRNMPAHPHNVFIHTFLDSGFLGLIVFIYIILVSYGTVFRVANDHNDSHLVYQTARLCFVVLTMLIITGFTDDFVAAGSFLFFLTISAISQVSSVAEGSRH